MLSTLRVFAKRGSKLKKPSRRNSMNFTTKVRHNRSPGRLANLENKINALYQFLRERFNEDFIQTQKEWLMTTTILKI